MTPPPAAAALLSSFDTLCKHHAPMIDAILRSSVAARDRDDARQEALAGLWSRYPAMLAEEQAALAAGLPSPHSWRAYIKRTVENVAKDFAKFYRDNLSRDVSLDLPPVPHTPAGDEPEPLPLSPTDSIADPTASDPPAAALDDDLALVLLRALKKMSPEERSAALARLAFEADESEAERQGCSRSTARRRRLAAQSQLKDALIAAGYFPDKVSP